jgi:type IV secretory pathway VirB6-like protein
MEEYLIISFFVAISFFIFKLVLNKIKNENREKNSDVMKDSLYVLIITFVVIYGYSNFFKKTSGKTPVFTNEPGF